MTGGHRFDPTILREYDIRGVVGETLSSRDAGFLGRAFGTLARRRGAEALAVGYDGRFTSPELEAALVEGLTSCGLKVVRIGRGPTPMLSFAACTLAVDGGIMVTGSHNPPAHNGFKMTLKGAPVFGAAIQDLGRLAAAGDFEAGAGRDTETSVFEAYVARLLEDYDGTVPLKVVWDAGNGAAGEAMAALAARLPGEHRLLNETIDGSFPAHHPTLPCRRTLFSCRKLVRGSASDLGIAFDGDGDRIGAVDGQGRILWGDQIMLYLARDVLKQHPGATIIADVKASQVLFDGIAEAGGRPLMWKTGHSLIKAKMKPRKRRALRRGDERPSFLRRPLLRLRRCALRGRSFVGRRSASRRREPRPSSAIQPAGGREHARDPLSLLRGPQMGGRGGGARASGVVEGGGHRHRRRKGQDGGRLVAAARVQHPGCAGRPLRGG